MHETYVAECLLRQVREVLPVGMDPHGVTMVGLRIGYLDAIAPDSLIQMFRILRDAYDLPNANIEIEFEVITCRCKDCGATSVTTEPVFICPSCDGVRLALLTGRGITLTEIEVEEEYLENPDHTKRT